MDLGKGGVVAFVGMVLLFVVNSGGSVGRWFDDSGVLLMIIVVFS